MKKIILLLFIGLFAAQTDSFAQFSKYIVRLKDKATNPYSLSNPIQYLTQRSIDRRTRYNIAMDSTDLPITPRYIDSIRLAGAVTILNSSKWLNQVAIQTNDAAALIKINSFPFVISTAPLAPRNSSGDIPVNKKLDVELTGIPDNPAQSIITADYYNYGQSYGQVHLHNGEFLHNRGFRGQGMHMAVLDAGFFNYLTVPTFDSTRINNRILGTWDFVANHASVNEDHPHGMQCLSTIAANMPGVFMGTAPNTSFYLYRTEDVGTEYPVEEQNWVAGMERADSLGIDISSTSLGYFNFDNPVFNYTYATHLDGNTTLSARGADMAAKKGILVVMAAGNEGSGAWHFIITPSDADSVMAVGAVNTSGIVGGFSSYGPSSDGQIKPSVAAVGVAAVIANPSSGQPGFGSGTSFACPNMAGLTTCLWQAFPEVNNMRIITVMQESATRATNPNDRVGYGIPDMKKAFVKLIKQLYTQQWSVADCRVTIGWTAKTDSAIRTVLERKLPGETNYTVISSIYHLGEFSTKIYAVSESLGNFPTSGIWYRVKMNIAADTSFYLDSMLVNFTPRPNLGADKTVGACSPNSVDLTTQFVTAGLTTNWTLAGNTVTTPATVFAPGVYQLIAINTSGCADTATVTVTFNPKPALGADQAITKCTDSIVNLTNLFTTTGLTTAWTIGGNAVANPASVTAAGIYRLIATNANACNDTALVTITNNQQNCTVTLPEQITISPNPVRDNLSILIVRTTAVKVEVLIHNAAGQLVYRSASQQPAGPYTYSIPMKKMGGGTYFVTVRLNDKKEVVKKILQQ